MGIRKRELLYSVLYCTPVSLPFLSLFRGWDESEGTDDMWEEGARLQRPLTSLSASEAVVAARERSAFRCFRVGTVTVVCKSVQISLNLDVWLDPPVEPAVHGVALQCHLRLLSDSGL